MEGQVDIPSHSKLIDMTFTGRLPWLSQGGYLIGDKVALTVLE